MRDLELYRLLGDSPHDAGALAPLLRQLAGLPLHERAPLLGHLGPALKHPDAGLRAAALSALAGAHGHAAWEWLAEGLRDAEAEVRAEALEALRESCRHDPQRWAHALFHRDAGVRQAALAPDRPFPLPWQAKLHLLKDEACRPLVRAEMEKHGADRDVVALVFGYLREGAFTPEEVRRWTEKLRYNAWLEFLAPLLPRTDDPTPILEDALKPDWPTRLPPLEQDRLAELLSLFWGEEKSPFFAVLTNGALAEAPAFRGWLAYRLLLHGAHAGRWPAPALALACVLWPFALGCEWLPVEARLAAVPLFYEVADRCPGIDGDRIKHLFSAPLFWEDGVPRLWAMGGLLHAVRPKPYQVLLEAVGQEALARGFRADFERAVALLRVSDRHSDGRQKFIELIARRSGHAAPRVLALLAVAVPADQIGFLEGYPLADILGVHEVLLTIEAAGAPLADNKVTRLARKLADRFAPEGIAAFLAAWLRTQAPANSALSQAVLGRLLNEAHAGATVRALAGLGVAELRAFLAVLPGLAGMPYERETELALLLRSHADEEIRAWAVKRTTPREEAPTEAPVVRSGVVGHLAGARGPSVPACVALLSSDDPLEEVVAAFGPVSSAEAAFVTQLDVEMVRLWRGQMKLPFLGHAWLYRWDQHMRHLAGLFVAGTVPGKTVAGFLRWASGLPAPALAARLWLAAARLMEQWRWHEAARYAAALDDEFGAALAEALRGEQAEAALGLLLQWKARCPPAAEGALERVRQKAALMLAELPHWVREKLAGWVGTFSAPIPARPAAVAEERVEMTPEALERAAASSDGRYAVPAARELLRLGRDGAQRLARAIDANPAVTWPLALLPLLPGASAPVLEALSRLVRSGLADAQTRFRVGRAIWEALDVDDVDQLVEAVCAESAPGWLNADDALWLVSAYPGPERELAPRLVHSPHPAAYGRAAHLLAAEKPLSAEARACLLAFLERGTARLRAFRVEAAAALYEAGEREAVLPVLLGEKPGDRVPYPALLGGLASQRVLAVARGLLAVGGEAPERLLLALLDNGHDIATAGWTETVVPGTPSRVDGATRQEALALMLDQVRAASLRQEVRRRLAPGQGRTHKLRLLARTFAWGVRLGRQLTGELFDLEMIAGEQLGYTRLNEHKLFISALPILRGEQDGREVVKGLILHEYGHHLYHKSPEALKVWDQAQRQKMHSLLNLVSDEHLERNLRSRDEEFGNWIKVLAAYAFQHAAREVEVEALLKSLGSRAFEVLTGLSLQAGRARGTVRVSAGGLLHQMDRAGLSFARFMRALRMGLGNRHGDEKVGRALALFKGAAFRSSSMPRLMEIAHELRRIFGEECSLLDCVGQDETLCGSNEEVVVLGEGITNEELQRAVQRALEEPGDEEPEKGNPVRVINKGPQVEFPLIGLVQPRPFDPRKYAKYARRVSRQAARLRQVLAQLGLALEPRPMRVQGRTLDRARLRPLVVRGDPRVLIAREARFRTDLFLGVLIDCSGSMAMGDNIEKAKLFAALLAESARGLRGIDVRFWGFTDCRIFDCGNALKPAVHDLVPTEGNNDAAALHHAAQEAKASKRKARLLVMISDGSPTACTVTALRNYVRQLTSRQGFLCAQVAVRPLDEVCFPHYVLLEENRVDEAVKRFGMVVLKLVRQALGG